LQIKKTWALGPIKFHKGMVAGTYTTTTPSR
jgi:hypothetical protein